MIEDFVDITHKKPPVPVKEEEIKLDWTKVDVAEAKRLQQVIEEKYLIQFNNLMDEHHYDAGKVKFQRLLVRIHFIGCMCWIRSLLVTTLIM